jgi:hypothetical protein
VEGIIRFAEDQLAVRTDQLAMLPLKREPHQQCSIL